MNKATKKLTPNYLTVIYKQLGVVTELNDGKIVGFRREKKKDATESA